MHACRHPGAKSYLILGSIGTLAAEAVELPARSSTDKTVSLERLVILDVLLELAQRVTRC